MSTPRTKRKILLKPVRFEKIKNSRFYIVNISVIKFYKRFDGPREIESMREIEIFSLMGKYLCMNPNL